jgi:hypothetical protein
VPSAWVALGRRPQEVCRKFEGIFRILVWQHVRFIAVIIASFLLETHHLSLFCIFKTRKQMIMRTSNMHALTLLSLALVLPSVPCALRSLSVRSRRVDCVRRSLQRAAIGRSGQSAHSVRARRHRAARVAGSGPISAKDP